MPTGQAITGFALPQAKDKYDRETLQYLLDEIKRMGEAFYTKNADLEVYAPPGPGGRQPRFILRSPDGNQWSITVDNAGVIAAVAI